MKKVPLREFAQSPTDYLTKLPIVLTQYNKPIAIIRSYSAASENEQMTVVAIKKGKPVPIINTDVISTHTHAVPKGDHSVVVTMKNKKVIDIQSGELVKQQDVEPIEDVEFIDRETTATKIPEKPRSIKKAKVEVPASKSASKKMITPFSICPKHKSMYKSCGCSYE